MVKSYKKKPIIIQALQWSGFNVEEMKKFAGKSFEYDVKYALMPDPELGLSAITSYYIKTLEGRMSFSSGDYILKGVNGEFYPCRADIFEKTYEEVPE